MSWVYAEPAKEQTAQELKDIKQDIKAERVRLEALDAERDAELGKLNALENQQAEAGRAFYAASFAVSNKESQLEDLRARHAALNAEIAQGLVDLEGNLRALYLLGVNNDLEGLLSPGGRTDNMRVEGYLAQLRASRVDALLRLRVAREDNLRVQHEIEFALEDLKRLQLVAEFEKTRLDGLRTQHQKTVDDLDASHLAGEAKVRQMTRDQNALERTLQKLEQAEAQAQAEAKALVEKREEEAARAQRAQQAEAQQQREQEAAERSRQAAEPDEPSEKPELKQAAQPPEKEISKLAAQDEGDTRKAQSDTPADHGEIPVRGRKVRGFGEPTGVGDLRSRGIFFAAPEGSRVRSLAEGKVVFADWVRGYGNLIIVQHKGGYLSLYAQNEAVLKSVGARVQRGEVLATAGRSGGERQTGVYVEVRRGGKPMNPTLWSAWPKK